MFRLSFKNFYLNCSKTDLFSLKCNKNLNGLLFIRRGKDTIFFHITKKNINFAENFFDMIQRRQTIFMLLAVIASALLFFMPLASFNAEGNAMKFTIFGIQNPIETLALSKSYTWPLIVLTVLMTVLPLYTIFKYKKRELQVKLCHLNMLLNIVFIGIVFLYYDGDIQKVIAAVEGDSYQLDVAYFFGMVIPLLNLLFEILAIRGIKKDIELLKSVDRLR